MGTGASRGNSRGGFSGKCLELCSNVSMFFVSGGGGGGGGEGYNQMIHENQKISYVLLRNATAPHHSCILYIKNSFRKRMMAYAS